MAPTAVAIAEQAIDAWNHGQLERLLWLTDDEVILRHPAGWPEPGPSRGLDEMRRQLESVADQWAQNEIEPLEYRTVGERVVVPARWTAAGGRSQAPVDMTFTLVFTVRRSRIAALGVYGEDEPLPAPLKR